MHQHSYSKILLARGTYDLYSITDLRAVFSCSFLNVDVFCVAESDLRFRLTETLLCEERDYSAYLGSAGELYGSPLTKLTSLTADEHFLLFGGLCDLAAVSKQLCSQVSNQVS